MCIIICAPKGRHIPGKHLKNSLRNNQDGWGVMWAEHGTLQIATGLHPDEFWKAWKWIKDIKSTKVFHARVGTHGTHSLENCHPFAVPGRANLGVVHNGIIHHQAYSNSDKSDTRHFVDDVLAGMPLGFEKSKSCQELIGKYISYGKMVFLDGDGEHTIVNEEKGEWVSGCWYSNSMWRNSANCGTKFQGYLYGNSTPHSATNSYQNAFHGKVWSQRCNRFVTQAEKDAEIDSLIAGTSVAVGGASSAKGYLEDKTRELSNEEVAAEYAGTEKIDEVFEDFSEEDVVAAYEKQCLEEMANNPQTDLEDWYYSTEAGMWVRRFTQQERQPSVKQNLDVLSDEEWRERVSESRRMGFQASRKAEPLTGTMSASEYKKKLQEAKNFISSMDVPTGKTAKLLTVKNDVLPEASPFPCKLPSPYDKPAF